MNKKFMKEAEILKQTIDNTLDDKEALHELVMSCPHHLSQVTSFEERDEDGNFKGTGNECHVCGRKWGAAFRIEREKEPSLF